jgi:glycosyltransferase involved in cell wall biosynthesis
VWARQATPTPLGQEFYQQQVIAALRAVTASEWTFDEVVTRSMRSTLAGNRRLPVGVMARAPYAAVAAVGRVLYGRSDLVHRFDLRLPPAKHEVVTVQDVAPLRFDDEGTLPRFLLRSAREALGAICVSKFSAQEAVDVFGVRRTWVAYGGVEDRFFEADPLGAADRARLGLPGRYVLHAGGASKRKNLAALAACWPAVRAEHPDVTLVLIGPEHPRRSALFGDLADTKLLGHVDDALMPRLVAAASAVVVPSLYEGFGLPALEAMAAGTPVVASDRASLPEVVGDAGLLVPPTPDDIGAGLVRVLADGALANRLSAAGRTRARGFTWAKCAAVHLQAYAESIEG